MAAIMLSIRLVGCGIRLGVPVRGCHFKIFPSCCKFVERCGHCHFKVGFRYNTRTEDRQFHEKKTLILLVTTRPKSPSRTEAIASALINRPIYSNQVLIGNWVEERTECPKTGTLYFPPKENIDYVKLKPESRQPDFRLNKLNNNQGNIPAIIRHDSHDSCPNYATTNDLVYNHLPKPLCGPIQRYYKRAPHQWYPQPDLMKCYGNVTEWGLRKYMQYEWKCTDVSDYSSTVYEDTFVPPLPHQYLQRNERKARDSRFTKSFRFKMTKSK